MNKILQYGTVVAPVLLIVFNRLEKAQKMLELLKTIKPPVLYVSADGPRLNNEEDIQKCAAVRAYISKAIDWKCELKTRFLATNLGCGLAPSSAISWFFEQEEYGILLEDDCIPHEDYFYLATHLLRKYKDNSDVWLINGLNYAEEYSPKKESLFRSKVAQTPSFATWKRAWNHFDFTISDTDDDIYKVIQSIWDYPPFIEKWVTKIMSIKYGGRKDIWDEQWVYTMWKLKGVCLTPSKNMVNNIGFGEDSTHHHNSFDELSLLKVSGFKKALPSHSFKSYVDYDRKVFRKIYRLEPKPSISSFFSLKNLLHSLKLVLIEDYSESIRRAKILKITPRYIHTKIPFQGLQFEVKDKQDFIEEYKTYIEGDFLRSINFDNIDSVIDSVSEVGLFPFALSKISPNKTYYYQKEKELLSKNMVSVNKNSIAAYPIDNLESDNNKRVLLKTSLDLLKGLTYDWKEDILNGKIVQVVCKYNLIEGRPNQLGELLSWCENKNWRYNFISIPQKTIVKNWNRFYDKEIENTVWILLKRV